jgi:hypothetical protein
VSFFQAHGKMVFTDSQEESSLENMAHGKMAI